MSTTHASTKSPYIRGNSARRSRGSWLLATVIILLLAVGAWMTVFTRAIETTQPNPAPVIDPGARTAPATH